MPGAHKAFDIDAKRGMLKPWTKESHPGKSMNAGSARHPALATNHCVVAFIDAERRPRRSTWGTLKPIGR